MPINQKPGRKSFSGQNRGPFAPKPAPGKREDHTRFTQSKQAPGAVNRSENNPKPAFGNGPRVRQDNAVESRQTNTKTAHPFQRGEQSGYKQDRRAPQGNPGNRFGRPAPNQETSEWKDSPASQRFGPGSRPFNASKSKLPDRRLIPAPHRVSPQQFDRPRPQALPAIPPEPVIFQEPDIAPENILCGRNPIREALKAGRDLEKLLIAKGELSGSAREIVSLAKAAGVMIQPVERIRLDQIIKNHQGMIAFASAYQYSSIEEILEEAKEKNEEPFVIVLDQITDPHNLGAIIRTASCAGAHGVIIPLHRAVGLTPAAVKASAGAIEHIKVARVTNLNQTIKDLQKRGIWFYAADPEGEDYRSVSLSGPCALVIGSEGEGVSKLTTTICDKKLRIPMCGELDSLNASVAAGILMYTVHNVRNKLPNPA